MARFEVGKGSLLWGKVGMHPGNQRLEGRSNSPGKAADYPSKGYLR